MRRRHRPIAEEPHHARSSLADGPGPDPAALACEISAEASAVLAVMRTGGRRGFLARRFPTPLDLASGYRRLSPSLCPPAYRSRASRHPTPRSPAGHHARSLSQPLFFSLDSLPPPSYADPGARGASLPAVF